jgi:hypothetical protein
MPADRLEPRPAGSPSPSAELVIRGRTAPLADTFRLVSHRDAALMRAFNQNQAALAELQKIVLELEHRVFELETPLRSYG